jgi:hypothetical protein
MDARLFAKSLSELVSMLPYKEPTLEQLQTAIDALQLTITRDRKPELLALKQLAKEVEGENGRQILMGAIIFEMRKVSNGYSLRSPTNSGLFQHLQDDVLKLAPKQSVDKANASKYLLAYDQYRNAKRDAEEEKRKQEDEKAFRAEAKRARDAARAAKLAALYKEPSAEALCKAINELKSDDSSHLAIIAELKQFAKEVTGEQANKILVGAVIFALEKIYLSYRVFSPAKDELYKQLLKNVLGLEADKSIDPKQKLVYLHYYYDHQKKAIAREAKDLPKPSEPVFVKADHPLEVKKEVASADDEFFDISLTQSVQIDPLAKQFALTVEQVSLQAGKRDKLADLNKAIGPVNDHIINQIPELQLLLRKRPQIDGLIEQARGIPIAFEQTYVGADNLWNLTAPCLLHKQFSLLIQLINDPKTNNLFFFLSDTKDPDDPKFKAFKYTVLYGALFYFVETMEKGYNYNTVLGGICLNVLNIDSTRDVPALIKFNILADFRKFLLCAQLSDFAPQFLQTKPEFADGVILSAEKPGEFLKYHANQIDALLKEKSFLERCARNAGHYLFLTAAGYAIFEISVLGYGFGIGRGAFIHIGGVLGELFIRGPWGGIIGRNYGEKHEKDTVVSSLASTIAEGSKKLYNLIRGNKNTSRFDNLDAATQYRNKLEEELSPDEFQAIAEELIEDLAFFHALTILPSAKVPEEVRERVRESIVKPLEERVEEVETRRLAMS